MGKGKRRSKKKARPEKMGSDGVAMATPAPRPSSGGAAKAAEATSAAVMNRVCINCDNCGVANPQICCSRCLCNYYCSKECQLKGWKRHKRFCAASKKERGNYIAARDKNNLPAGTSAVMDGPCAICLEEEIKHPVTFECGHAFCFKCIHIYQCKEEKPTCPYCRGEIPDVEEKAYDRLVLYVNRAEKNLEGSDERKAYCHLAMAEYDALSLIYNPWTFLGAKAQIISLSKDPEALLKVTDKMLSGNQSGDLKLDNKEVGRTKLLRAQAYSEMGKWTEASEIYWELRKEDLGDVGWIDFKLEMGHCRCLFELGEYHKAVESGIRAVYLGRMCPGVHEYLALAQKAAGNIDAAKKTMSRAILHEQPWDVENLERNRQILRDLERNVKRSEVNLGSRWLVAFVLCAFYFFFNYCDYNYCSAGLHT